MRTLLTTLLLSVCLISFGQKAITQSPFTGKVTATQTLKRNCFTDDMERKLQEKYPDRMSTHDFERKLAAVIRQNPTARMSEEIYRIPTIVHVVHNGEQVGTDANITEAQVLSQFDILNEDFRRLGNGFNEHEAGADVFVEFYPVTLDPDGIPLDEPGINRIDGEEDFWGQSAIETNLKPNTIWDPERYFNIWVVNFGGDLEGVLGYAQFPSLSGLAGLNEDGGPAETDGIVVGYQFFGNTGNVQAPFDLGRTTTHEVGHWLGLRHIWGDGGCEVDDFCDDTPNAGGPNYGCSENDSCTGDGPDMIENYMDYTDDACMNIFTLDQKARIRAVLEVSPRRNTLLGPACEDAESVQLGTVTTTAPQWYTYTSAAEKVVTISSVGQTTENTYVAVYNDCNQLPINFSDDALGSEQSQLSVLVGANETIKINWSARFSDVEFNWELSEADAAQGLACALADQATTGENQVGATSNDVMWYSYTVSAEVAKVTINSGGKKAYVYGNECSQLDLLATTDDEVVLVDLLATEDLYIALEVDGGNFSWSLTEEALSEGESCLMAVDAVAGTNSIPSTPYWYTYTMTDFGTLNLSSTGAAVETYLEVYDECGGKILAENVDDGSGQSDVTIDLTAGEEVLILWDSINGTTGFDWMLTEEPLEGGELCEVAIEAAEGVNAAPNADIWYSYEMVADGHLNISSVGLTTQDTYLTVYDVCGGEEIGFSDDFSQLQSEVTIFDLQAGESVVFHWDDVYDNAAFDFEVTELEPVPGDACSSALEAVEGSNTAEFVTSWYVHTVTADKNIIISSAGSGVDTDLIVYDACDGEIIALNDDIDFGNDVYQSEVLIVGASVGDELYINWLDTWESSGFDWTIEYVDPVPGEDCEDPAQASLGTNTTAVSALEGLWFSFTVPNSDKKYVISGEAGEFVGATSDCDITEIYGSGVDQLILIGLEANQEILIFWENVNGVAFEWEITESDLEQGDDCSDPLEAVTGTNSTAYAPAWYTFTVPKDADVRISSVNKTVEDTFVKIFDQCGGMSVAESDDAGDDLQSEVLLEGVAKGEVLLIYWDPAYSSAAFDWQLSLENIVNAKPSFEDHSFSISESTDGDGTVLGTVAGTDDDGDALTYTILSGNADGAFELHETDGTLTLLDFNAINFRNDEIVLRVSAHDGFAQSSANVTIELIALGLQQAIDFSVYPNPTSEVLTIEVSALDQFSGGLMTDLSGRIVKTIAAEDRAVDVSHLSEGIYLLKLTVNDEAQQARVIVRH